MQLWIKFILSGTASTSDINKKGSPHGVTLTDFKSSFHLLFEVTNLGYQPFAERLHWPAKRVNATTIVLKLDEN